MANKKQIKTIIKKDQQIPAPVSLSDVQSKIVVLRGEPVILDRDVAKLYGVETREINQALKNNLIPYSVNISSSNRYRRFHISLFVLLYRIVVFRSRMACALRSYIRVTSRKAQ